MEEMKANWYATSKTNTVEKRMCQNMRHYRSYNDFLNKQLTEFYEPPRL